MELIIVQDDAIVSFSANFVLDKLNMLAHSTNKSIVLGLSGGSSPKALYRLLADLIPQKLAKRIILIQIDERIVDPNHQDSNQFLINDTLQKLMDKGAKFYAMPTHSTDAISCAEYEALLSSMIIEQSCPAIALLGVGEDGHTASIFPDQIEEIPNDNRLVFMTPREKNGYYRMSLSFAAIAAMKMLVLYAPGKNKRPIVDKIEKSSNIEKYPAAKALHAHEHAYVLASLV